MNCIRIITFEYLESFIMCEILCTKNAMNKNNLESKWAIKVKTKRNFEFE